MVIDVLRHLQQYFSYIVVVSFLAKETGVPGENHRPAQVTDKLYLIMLYRIHIGIEKHNNICTKYKTV